MASKVEIANFALTRIGESQRITSLSDNTESAKMVNAIYEETARCVMAESTFSSTIRRKALALTTTTPAFQYTYEFQLPTNPKCLRVVTINSTSTDTRSPNSIPYVVEGDKLLTNVSTCNIVYVAHLTDSEDYGPYLTTAIIYKLSSELAYGKTGSISGAQKHVEEYQRYIARLRSVDSMQGSNFSIDSNPLYDVR